MIHVTARARERFKEALDDMVDRPGLVLRLGPTGAGLGVYLDTRQDDDHVVEHEGQAVLLVGRDVSEALAGKTIDVEESTEGPRFVLRTAASPG